jgi:eukaryotic-like serine/threonine-protein kinase
MNRLRAIIIEVHRRSLWQVLGIYLVGSWIGYEVIQGLTEGLGLPHWVPAFAVVLFIIGLPLVLATAFVQEGPAFPRFGAPPDPTLLPDIERFDATSAAAPHTVVAPDDDAGPRPRAARVFTWGRALASGVAAFLFLGLTTGGYMGMRAAGVGPAATLLSRGELTGADRLVLADFGATSVDTMIAAAITDALRIDLEQSRAVALAPMSFLHGAMQRMELPRGARLPEPLALQLAQREGLKAVITGDVARVGNAFTISARVLRAEDGEPLVSVRERAGGEADLLDALDRLSRRLRERIGESLRTVHASDPLAQVTTSSLEALQLYSQAGRLQLHGSSNDLVRATQLAERAIAIDTGFAMAYRLLGIISGNAVFDQRRSAAMLTRAYELGERLTERERLATAASYHGSVSGETQRAIAAWEQLLASYPDDLSALNNVAILYSRQGDRDRAVELYERVIAQDTTRRISQTNLVAALISTGRMEEARAVLQTARRRFPGDPQIEQFEAVVHLADGDLAAARRSSEAFRAQARDPFARILALGNIGVLDGLEGRPSRALTHAGEMLELLRRAGVTASIFGVLANIAAFRIEHLGEPPDRALADLEAELSQRNFESLPATEMPLADLAETYALAGRHDRALALRDRFDNEVVRVEGLRSRENELMVLDGRLLVHDGRAADGARLLRAAREQMHCDRCLVPDIAWAYAAATMPDSALIWFDRYLDTRIALGPNELKWRTRSLQRAAELHEAAGNTERARLYYGRLLEMWADAEPSMRPRVETVRASLARLMGIG